MHEVSQIKLEYTRSRDYTLRVNESNRFNESLFESFMSVFDFR